MRSKNGREKQDGLEGGNVLLHETDMRYEMAGIREMIYT